MDISEHSMRFVQEMERRNYSKNTIDCYLSNIQKFFSWTTKDHPKNINVNDITNYLHEFKDFNTQKSHHSAIKLFYKICLHQKNKFKYVPYCRKSKKLPIILSQDEIQGMFNTCKNTKHLVILSLLYSCGLRASELINLQWSHLDRNRKIINIIAGKGKKDRQVNFPSKIIPLLEKYYREYKPQIYVLNGQKSIKYSRESILRVVKNLALKSGISKRTYTHLIRHNCFSQMISDGTDISLVQEIAGHENISSTRIYIHLSDSLISKVKSPIQGIHLNY